MAYSDFPVGGHRRFTACFCHFSSRKRCATKVTWLAGCLRGKLEQCENEVIYHGNWIYYSNMGFRELFEVHSKRTAVIFPTLPQRVFSSPSKSSNSWLEISQGPSADDWVSTVLCTIRRNERPPRMISASICIAYRTWDNRDDISVVNLAVKDRRQLSSHSRRACVILTRRFLRGLCTGVPMLT